MNPFCMRPKYQADGATELFCSNSCKKEHEDMYIDWFIYLFTIHTFLLKSCTEEPYQKGNDCHCCNNWSCEQRWTAFLDVWLWIKIKFVFGIFFAQIKTLRGISQYFLFLKSTLALPFAMVQVFLVRVGLDHFNCQYLLIFWLRSCVTS